MPRLPAISTMVPFNRPHLTGREFAAITEAIAAGHLAGNGGFTKRCQAWLEREIGCAQALLTHSCTGALEMAALLLDLQPGDEVVMPSFTFVSTANAFALRGARPVFVDIRPDTLNLDETLLESAITPRTRAIVPVHYGGVGCGMDAILEIAQRHGLAVVEDAAQGLLARYGDRPLGSIGHLAAVSFHETKNVIAGEGGALLINDRRFLERAEIVWEKGTDRSRFYRGQVDKYTWQDIGSSFQPSEITAAFLWPQLEESRATTDARMAVWSAYHEAFADLERREIARRPMVPAPCSHNAHVYYLLVDDLPARTAVLSRLNAAGVNAIFHYVPLHLSPAGRRVARVSGSMRHTEALSERLIRLPLWAGLTANDIAHVIEQVRVALGAR